MALAGRAHKPLTAHNEAAALLKQMSSCAAAVQPRGWGGGRDNRI